MAPNSAPSTTLELNYVILYLFDVVELKIVRLALSGGKPSDNVLLEREVFANWLSGQLLSNGALSDAVVSVNL